LDCGVQRRFHFLAINSRNTKTIRQDTVPAEERFISAQRKQRDGLGYGSSKNQEALKT
jgi:hypothetical protein